MAWRAALRGVRRADGIVALGGDIPPELKGGLRGAPPVLLARGRDDDLYPAAQFDQDLAALRAEDVPVEPFVYDGGHAWNDAVLARAGEFLEAIRTRKVA
jgi:predicted esterase